MFFLSLLFFCIHIFCSRNAQFPPLPRKKIVLTERQLLPLLVCLFVNFHEIEICAMTRWKYSKRIVWLDSFVGIFSCIFKLSSCFRAEISWVLNKVCLLFCEWFYWKCVFVVYKCLWRVLWMFYCPVSQLPLLLVMLHFSFLFFTLFFRNPGIARIQLQICAMKVTGTSSVQGKLWCRI